ncbi:uncharacterized protein BXZ73DRAFT_96465 [Epithele typhae]|uniref:uncharacterized protein n=1 Tax=Epithele typhae TaxID=378194 RepID=UPI002007E5FC|nr:uncharacterized protein BXZ73DRAFT_96465 [Epithele typhae]KAH9945476.1 hypothetical protein BXZ73DRAFT_96465 [Epithele typhae]
MSEIMLGMAVDEGRNGPEFKMLTLELGGNDAAIVLDDDVDPAAIAKTIVQGVLHNAEQTCFDMKRIYDSI